MLFPSLPNSASAEESGSAASLNVASAVAITLPDTVTIDVTPTPNGTFSSTNVNLAISTNNNTGYALYFSTADQDNHMHSQNPSNTETIAPVTNSVTEANFPNNSWGYNLRDASEGEVTSSTAYTSVPTSSNTALKTTSSASSDNYNLTFGAKVDTNIPAGTYTNTVTVSAVANPPLITDITSLGTMQEMTPEVCEATEVGTTATLTDSRDNNTYTVAKLPDGACWMTQNLRLSGGRTLTPADSNVSSNWSFPNNSLTSGNTYDEARSAINSNTSYGGYYNYCAASAGTVCFSLRRDATQDICPKGWRLPTYDEQDGITSYTSAFSPVYSGYYIDGSLRNTGSFGVWWSATADTSTNQYSLYYDSGSLSTDLSNKRSGRSVRCIRAS